LGVSVSDLSVGVVVDIIDAAATNVLQTDANDNMTEAIEEGVIIAE
jgi:hypothetical protein